MNHTSWRGVWVPALTPFSDDLNVNHDAFVGHCHWLLEQGADGLAVFGTTSEANSLTLAERKSLLEALVGAGIPAERLMPGVGCTALPDTVDLCRHAARQGCRGVLMLPPFYYKGVSDEGLFAAFSWVIERMAAEAVSVFAYHIPPVSGVPLSIPLLERLQREYPGFLAGLKDSGGDWGHTSEALRRLTGMSIFAGSERFLLDTLRHGGAGCITASGNVNPAGIRAVYEAWLDEPSRADAVQERVTALRDMLEQFPMIPALKALCAEFYGDEAWRNVRPPLMPLPDAARDRLSRLAGEHGFSLGRNRAAMLDE